MIGIKNKLNDKTQFNQSFNPINTKLDNKIAVIKNNIMKSCFFANGWILKTIKTYSNRDKLYKINAAEVDMAAPITPYFGMSTIFNKTVITSKNRVKTISILYFLEDNKINPFNPLYISMIRPINTINKSIMNSSNWLGKKSSALFFKVHETMKIMKPKIKEMELTRS